MTEGPDWNAFHHDYFLRGDLQSCRLMARLNKSRAPSAPNHHTCDPDFYALPFMPELTQTFCLYGGNNNPAELLAPATDPAEDRESAAVALLAVGASGTAICTTTSTTTTSRSSSNKRPRSKSNETKSFKKKRTDEGIPPIPASLVDISHPTTTNGPELMTWVRNPPSLTLVPPQWSAATTTAAFLPLQQEQVRSILLAAPTTYLPSATTNVFIPSSSADVVDMEFHARILRAQEDITRLSSAWMEARWTMAQIAAARRNVESRHHSWIPSTMFHLPSNRTSSLPAVVVAAASSLSTAEPRLVFPRLW